MSDDVSSFLVSPKIDIGGQIPEKPLKLGVLASGSGSNFQAIIEAIDRGDLNAQVQVLIYNNPGIKAVERANKYNIPTVLLNHRDYPHREELDRSIIHTLKSYDVDLVILAGWMRVVTEVLLDAYSDRVINIHPSLLPSFPGIKAVEQALKAGVKITGCTVHLVTLEVDSGPILIQAAVPILPDDNSTTLHQRIQIQEHHIFPQGILLAQQRLMNLSKLIVDS